MRRALAAAAARCRLRLPRRRRRRRAGRDVKIDNFTFGPPQRHSEGRDDGDLDQRDDIPHTVTDADQAFKSKALDTDDSFSFTFTAPGTYDYFCSLHPHMTGTIVVEASSAAQ